MAVGVVARGAELALAAGYGVNVAYGIVPSVEAGAKDDGVGDGR